MWDNTDNSPNKSDGSKYPIDLLTTARILDIIRSADSLPLGDIARMANLSRSAVVQHVDHLLAQGLVREGNLMESTGGRRARLLTFRRDAGYIAGVDLGATGVGIAITDLAGDIAVQSTSELDVRDGPDACLDHVRGSIKKMLVDLRFHRECLKAVSIGVPGPIEFDTGRPIAPPIMPGWDRYSIRDFFATDFSCPVYVDNDVNIMALGEQWVGLGRGVENFLAVKVGTGIGCGIVCGSRLYRGADGCAGDIGHIEVCGQSTICRCGNVGCLETVAGAVAWARLAHEAATAARSPMLEHLLAQYGALTARDVTECASKGDLASLEIIRESGRLIGQVLAGLVNFYNPSLIVVGGGVSETADSWLASIRQEVYRRSTPLGSRNLTIQRSQLGHRTGVVGAAALAIQQLFALPA